MLTAPKSSPKTNLKFFCTVHEGDHTLHRRECTHENVMMSCLLGCLLNNFWQDIFY